MAHSVDGTDLDSTEHPLFANFACVVDGEFSSQRRRHDVEVGNRGYRWNRGAQGCHFALGLGNDGLAATRSKWKDDLVEELLL